MPDVRLLPGDLAARVSALTDPSEHDRQTISHDRDHPNVAMQTLSRAAEQLASYSAEEESSSSDVLFMTVAATGVSPKLSGVMEVAIVNSRGHTELETLVHPERGIPEHARRRYGITDEMVISAPTLKEILP